ncbi:MAG TPA: LytR C-terminal domain-containing protein [Pseudonocardia sp.]|nr:LytR C-terminal domain-containing protein [Pseudonocardia sp.]
MAAGAADDFRKAGWTVNAVDNYAESQGLIATSTVYYRPGTNEQSSAELMRNEFGLRAAPRFAGLTDASPGLIVIVTNDYQRR